MKLLLVNFVMDQQSPVLAWQHSVASRLAARCERVVVLTEAKGHCDLPPNVEVHTVPRLFTTPLRLLGAKWLMNLPVWAWCAREQFDAVFVHMNAEWAYRLAPVSKRFNLPVLVWYAHGSVNRRLHRAHAHATAIVTSTPEGFRIPSGKVRVIGQGIDTAVFTPPASRADNATIAAVGRVSRRKSVHLMIEALAWLRAAAPQHPFRLRIVGPTLTKDDAAYATELADLVRARGLEACVTFDGPQPISALPAIYGSAFLHLNLSETGSMDKAILESLACGCPTMTSNPATFEMLSGFPELMLRDRTAEAIGARILAAYERRDALTADRLRAIVCGHHDLESYADKVFRVLSELAREAQAKRAGAHAVPLASRNHAANGGPSEAEAR